MKNKTEESSYRKEIDLVDLINFLLTKRKIILYTVTVSIFLGIVYALIIPPQYEAQTTMLPQLGDNGGMSSGLSGLASLAGVNLGQVGNTKGDISADLYPEIVNSVPFQVEMLNTEFFLEELRDTISYREYLECFSPKDPLNKVKKYTLGLPGLVINMLKGGILDEGGGETSSKDSLFKLNRSDFILIESGKRSLNASVDKKTGKVTLSMVSTHPKVAAIMTNRALTLLQDFVIDFRLAKARQEFVFIDKLLLEKMDEYESAQQKLSSFRDRNINITTSSARAELIRLEGEYQLRLGVYTEIAKQRESSNIEIQKNIPNFTIIDPVVVPLDKVYPSKLKIIITSFFLGLLFCLIILGAIEVLSFLRSKADFYK
ncbi:Wzz/FepE/Etk N-terminal domain-containing protein [Roseivirga echinicomitans]